MRTPGTRRSGHFPVAVRITAAFAMAVTALGAAPAHARGCHETSVIVGQQRCSRFGAGWNVLDRLPWIVELGAMVERVPLANMNFNSSVAFENSSLPFSVPGSTLGGPSTVGSFNLRVLTFPWQRVFYTGIEGAAGGGDVGQVQAVPPRQGPKAGQTEPGDRMWAVHSTGSIVLNAGMVAGISIPVWRFDLRAEVYAGVRATSVSFDLDNPDAIPRSACWGGAKGSTICPFAQDSDFNVTARLVPRVGLSFRATPWITTGFLVGADALDGGSISVGAWVQFHTRSYDGFYPRHVQTTQPVNTPTG